MEETKKIDPEHLKGINDGYLIAQYEPELAEKLSKIKAITPRIIGIQQGREIYLSEQIRDKRPSFLKDNHLTIDKNDLGKSRNKDRGIEPER